MAFYLFGIDPFTIEQHGAHCARLRFCLSYKGGALKIMGPLEIVLIAVGAVVLAAVMFAVGIGYR